MKHRASGFALWGASMPKLAVVLLITVLAGAVPAIALPLSAHAPLPSHPAGVVGSTPAGTLPPIGPADLRATLAPRSSATPNCQDPGLGVDLYDPTLGANGLTFWPLYPFDGGSPCPLTSQDPNAPTPFNDELHATFASQVNGSGSRWSVPIRLPGNSTYPEADAVNDFYIGMVVAGNNSSVDGQSYLQVVFTPEVLGNGNIYNVTLTVLSLFDSGYCHTGYRPSGLNLTWNNLAGCETDILNNGSGHPMMGAIPGGSYLTVTFNGANPNGITVYVNDSAQGRYSSSFTLSPSPTTNQSTFTPYYPTSCADVCYLNWSMPFGQGFGVDLGQLGLNTSIQSGTDPVWVGSPEYFTTRAIRGTTRRSRSSRPRAVAGGRRGRSRAPRSPTTGAIRTSSSTGPAYCMARAPTTTGRRGTSVGSSASSTPRERRPISTRSRSTTYRTRARSATSPPGAT